jgi:tRNA threonylcarbamoyladenosine biosynthesis protein TsaE
MMISDENAMRDFGEKLAANLQTGDWAGKTVLCSGILRGLGFAGEIASPSYAIVHSYDPPEVSIAVAHADLYRLKDVAELEELGLAEERGDRITLVEWAERAGPDYALPSHHISIALQPDGSRNITLKTETNDADY